MSVFYEQINDDEMMTMMMMMDYPCGKFGDCTLQPRYNAHSGSQAKWAL